MDFNVQDIGPWGLLKWTVFTAVVLAFARMVFFPKKE